MRSFDDIDRLFEREKQLVLKIRANIKDRLDFIEETEQRIEYLKNQRKAIKKGEKNEN